MKTKIIVNMYLCIHEYIFIFNNKFMKNNIHEDLKTTKLR